MQMLFRSGSVLVLILVYAFGVSAQDSPSGAAQSLCGGNAVDCPGAECRIHASSGGYA